MKHTYDELADKVELLENIIADLKLSELRYHLRRAASLERTVKKFSPLQVGDTVQIIKEMTITADTNWGWLGSKEYFRLGTLWRVRMVEVQNGYCTYGCVPLAREHDEDRALHYIEIDYIQKVKIVPEEPK
jgi:hypothetical protein